VGWGWGFSAVLLAFSFSTPPAESATPLQPLTCLHPQTPPTPPEPPTQPHKPNPRIQNAHRQVMSEVQSFLKMLGEVYGIFGLDYSMALSTR